MCRGEYPKPPFLRARPSDLAIAGMLFLGLGLVRRVRKEEPWSAFRAPMFAAVVGLAGAAAFLLAIAARLGRDRRRRANPLLRSRAARAVDQRGAARCGSERDRQNPAEIVGAARNAAKNDPSGRRWS
jgi:hypothetical protein